MQTEMSSYTEALADLFRAIYRPELSQTGYVA